MSGQKTGQASGRGASSYRDILVVVAMDEEESAVLAELRDRSSTESTFSQLGLRARIFSGAPTISVLKTGIGAVNAALGVALFAESHPLDAVVLLGVGGAIRTDLAIGDLVVSRRVLQHDYLFSLDFGTPRVRPGGLVFTKKDAESHSPYFTACPEILSLSLGESGASSFKLGTISSSGLFSPETSSSERPRGNKRLPTSMRRRFSSRWRRPEWPRSRKNSAFRSWLRRPLRTGSFRTGRSRATLGPAWRRRLGMRRGSRGRWFLINRSLMEISLQIVWCASCSSMVSRRKLSQGETRL